MNEATHLIAAVNQSIKAGYRPFTWMTEEATFQVDNDKFSSHYEFVDSGKAAPIHINETLMDPLFWQALGRALDWKPVHELDHSEWLICWGGMDEHYFQGEAWEYHWHCFIDHIAEGKDPDKFFKQLTKNT